MTLAPDQRWTVVHGKCPGALSPLADSSVDAVVTDPPYELKFMGRAWDASGIACSVDLWREVLRVLKPGGHLLAFGGTRTYHRMTCAIEDAGFEIRDSLHWMYGTGFPKSLNVGKAIDDAAGAEREVVGPGKRHGGGKDIRGGRLHAASEGAADAHGAGVITAPATEAAKQWDGWGTALKPGHEPIVMARKPLVGTVAANVLQHGTGALNIDGCRIGTSKDVPASGSGVRSQAFGMAGDRDGTSGMDPNQGRWPANVLLDEAAAAELDAQTEGKLHGAGKARDGSTAVVAASYDASAYELGPNRNMRRLGDSGGASRFFFVAKPDGAQRDFGCDDLGAATGGEATGRKDGSDGLKSPRAGAGRKGGRRNIHPTVKPVDLMQHLVRLVTPLGGVVLDPFAGSGTTGVACQLEGLRFLGVELEAEHAEIARRRIGQAERVAPITGSIDRAADIDPRQATLFDAQNGAP